MGFGAAAGLVVALLIVLSTIGSADDSTARRTVENFGVRLNLPEGWIRAPTSRLPQPFSSPRARLLVSSDPIVFDTPGCKYFTFAIQTKAIAILIVEWIDGSDNEALPGRPSRFTRETLGIRRGGLECWTGRGGSAVFHAADRALAAYVLLGPKAGDREVEDALKVLDTLRTASTG